MRLSVVRELDLKELTGRKDIISGVEETYTFELYHITYHVYLLATAAVTLRNSVQW